MAVIDARLQSASYHAVRIHRSMKYSTISPFRKDTICFLDFSRCVKFLTLPDMSRALIPFQPKQERAS